MPLNKKYPRYTPEITLEIFTLVYNKLVEHEFKPIHDLNQAWKEFSGQYPYFWCCTKNKPNQFEENSENLPETTVQEILGYDPFVNKKDWSKATHDELIKEAERRYLKGYKFISAYDKKSKWDYSGQRFQVFNGNEVKCYMNDNIGWSYVFYNGKWAEIISLPEVKSEPKQQLKQAVHCKTQEEINNHSISIGKIQAGEPLNTGIKPDKDGMFKYKQTMPGASWSGGTIDNHLDAMIPTTGNSYNKDFSTSVITVPFKLILSIDNDELPMVSIVKTNSIKQLLNND